MHVVDNCCNSDTVERKKVLFVHRVLKYKKY